MSAWATVDAAFGGVPEHGTHCLKVVDFPVGSESGPKPCAMEGGRFDIYGRVRDVDDGDAPRMLAWWVDLLHVSGAERSHLTLDFDRGPRYRYEYDREGGVRKLRGLLDL